MGKTTERRFLTGVELRAGKAGVIDGYAAVFNSPSQDLGGFIETIRSGAFSRAIRERQNVLCLFNHDSSLLLGRTSSGTLRLSQDDSGLYFECDTPDAPTGRNVYAAIERHDLVNCSFSFQTLSDDWNSDGSKRELIDLNLFDVGPVTNAAYLATSVDARSLWPQGVPAEVRSHRTREGVVGSYRAICGTPDDYLETERRRMRARLAMLE